VRSRRRDRCLLRVLVHVVLCPRVVVFFFQAEDGIRDRNVTGVQTCALPIYSNQLNYRTVFTNIYNHFFDFINRNKLLTIKNWLRSEERRVGKEWRSRW